MEYLRGLPFPLTVTGLFLIVLVRANATYWLGRAAHAGAGRTRVRRLLQSSGFRRAQGLLERWGAPVIAVSFLTVGFQTVANLAAGSMRMPLRRYLPAMIVGSVLWAFLYATVGFVTFAAIRRLWELSPVSAIVVVVLLVLALAGFVTAQVRARTKAEATHG